MPLRIGVVSGSQGAEWGGGGTLTAVLAAALKSVPTNHEFLFIDELLRPAPCQLPQAIACEIPQPGASEAAQAAPSKIAAPDALAADEKMPNPAVNGLLRSAIDRGVNVALRMLPEGVRSRFAKETSRDPPPVPSNQTLPGPCKPTIVELLEQAIGRERLDLVWYMIPNGFPVSVPYIATVWDLEHRKQPYFPQVRVPFPPSAKPRPLFTPMLPPPP